MIIVLVSECTDKALPRSRRILCKYLPMIGSRTWSGKISREGLECLYQELKTGITKNSSLACYLFKTRKILEPIWHLGNSSKYHDGNCAVSESSKLNHFKEIKPLTNLHKLMRSIVKLAALFHDVGKNNVGFQSKLRDNSIKDCLRHELVSLLILLELEKFILKSINKKPSEVIDTDYFTALSQSSLVKQFFEYTSQNYKLDYTLESLKRDVKFRKKYADRSLFWFAVKWLVASHHKLTDKTKVDSSQEFGEVIDIENLINATNESFNDNCTIKDASIFCEESYISQVADVAQTIVKQIQQIGTLDANLVFPQIVYFCRPILIYADYIGSINKKAGKTTFDQILANTIKGQPADSLTTHLKKVKCESQKIYNNFYNWDSLLPELESIDLISVTDKLSDNLSLEYKSYLGKNSNFQWQQQAINSSLALNDKHPFFGVVIAGTGSGKTRSIPKIVGALNKGFLRYTLCLGYRSLTLQTKDEYLNELGFSDKQLATVVGGVFTEDIYNLSKLENNSSKVENDESDGSSALLHEDEDELTYKVDYSKSPKLEIFGSMYNKEERKILAAPIVVSTIDHFVDCGSITRGVASKMMLRLISSDLVLDEIDSYSEEQLVVVGRLVYLAGLFGRGVLIVSATVTEVIVNSLFNTYIKALESFQYI